MRLAPCLEGTHLLGEIPESREVIRMKYDGAVIKVRTKYFSYTDEGQKYKLSIL